MFIYEVDAGRVQEEARGSHCYSSEQVAPAIEWIRAQENRKHRFEIIFVLRLMLALLR